MNTSPDQFIGGHFTWFTGVVEDIIDPQQMGRVRVRCIGFHTDDKGEVPTGSLPWATVLLPPTSASMSRIGRSATGLLQGSWVVGFFRDGPSAQDPIIMGSIAAISKKPNFARGFSDPSGTYPKEDGQTDIPLEATSRFADSDSYKSRAANVQGLPWTVPLSVAPSYPKNQVIRTESGHVVELDDTSGKERISIFHKSGTLIEFDAAGNSLRITTGTAHDVILGAQKVYVKGNSDIKVDGNCQLDVGGTTKIVSAGNMQTVVQGNYDITAVGNVTINGAIVSVQSGTGTNVTNL
jgi:hypothetical protein